MKKYITLFVLSLSYNAFALNTTDAYLNTGELDRNELISDYYASESKYPQDIDVIKQRIKNAALIPEGVKFAKMQKNPNYNAKEDINRLKKALPTNGDVCDGGMYQPPSSYMLPMNIQPLNQGQFGTCVTFSTLGAIQASTQNTNYNTLPSQSCALQMIGTTGKNVWNGADLDDVWGPILNNGYIQNGKIPNQLICNQQFPYYEPYGSTSQAGQVLSIPLGTYTANSVKPNIPLLQVYSHFWNKPAYYLRSALACPRYKNVKGNPGFYVQFTFMFMSSTVNQTITDATGTHTYTTYYADYGPPTNAGHSVYAYAYNDNICVQTPKGQQCGVIYFRNSWGNTSDNGNYLMTYDYYNTYAYNHSPMFYGIPNLNYN